MAIVRKKINLSELREAGDEAEGTKEIFFRSLAGLEADLEKIMEEVGADACDNTPRCVEAKLEIELYKAECDNVGAFKFKRFVREMSEAFAKSEQGTVPRELEGTRYLFINIGEIDRLNKQAHSQSAGDAGLEAVIVAARTVCRNILGEERASLVDIYRYGGNEYLVKLPGASDQELVALEEAIVNTDLKLNNFESLEAPPLSVYATSLDEVVDVFTSVELSSLESEPVDPIYYAGRIVDVMSREVDYNLEVKKFIARVNRTIEKLQAVKEGKLSREQAEGFFNNFLKKGFHDTDIKELKDIEELWANGSDPEDLQRVVELMAVTAARARFAADRKFQLYEDHLVSKRFLEMSRHLGQGAELMLPGARLDDEQKIAIIPRLTVGLAEMERVEEKMKAAADTEWGRAERLRYMIQIAKRDRGTGFLERGDFYRDWVDQIEAAEQTGEEPAVVFVDMGFLKYFNDAGGRKVGDAALRKAAELMEKAIEAAGVTGFAYRYGGDEFAIRLSGGRVAADKVVAELGKLRKEAGRIPDMEVLRDQTGDQEIIGKSRFDYAPTELVFNIGIAETLDIYEILNDLRESGELEDILETRNMTLAEFKAELLVKLADTSVNYEKATTRFHMLIELLNRPAYRDKKTAYYARVESIISYSQKAILGEMDGNDALRFFSGLAGREAPSILDKRIDDFVADRLEKIKKIVHGKKELTDKLVEIHAVRNRLMNQIEGLKLELAKKDEVLESENRRIEELQTRLQEAEEARRDIIAARREIGEGGVDKKTKMA